MAEYDSEVPLDDTAIEAFDSISRKLLSDFSAHFAGHASIDYEDVDLEMENILKGSSLSNVETFRETGSDTVDSGGTEYLAFAAKIASSSSLSDRHKYTRDARLYISSVFTSIMDMLYRIGEDTASVHNSDCRHDVVTLQHIAKAASESDPGEFPATVLSVLRDDCAERVSQPAVETPEKRKLLLRHTDGSVFAWVEDSVVRIARVRPKLWSVELKPRGRPWQLLLWPDQRSAFLTTTPPTWPLLRCW
jgi:hypothetical protein